MVPRRIQLVGAVLMVLLAAVAAPAGPLTERIERLIAEAGLSGATVTGHIVDLDGEAILAEVDSDRQMIPASNLKLITSGAALLSLGPNYAFETHLQYDGRRLIVVGSGDPALADPILLTAMDLSVEGLLDLWVEDVREHGILQLDEVVVDARIFDRQATHPTWEPGDLLEPYAAPVSGFNFFGNSLTFYVASGQEPTASPSWRVEPDVSRWLHVTNHVRATTDPRARIGISLARPASSNEFTLRGMVRQPQSGRVTIHNPSEFWARLLAERLRQRGVHVGSSRAADDGDPRPFEGEAIGRPIRTPVTTLLARCNQDSANLYAEALLKRIGHEITGQPGSWSNGAAVVRMLLSKHLGPQLATAVQLADGSGLSRDNRVTARVLTAWLTFLHEHPRLSEPYRQSLPVGGEEGTLRRRFTNIELAGEVRAKSGYIGGVVCLSGYVTLPSGRTAAFSILCNSVRPEDNAKARALHERIVKAIDEHLVATQRHIVEETVVPNLGG